MMLFTKPLHKVKIAKVVSVNAEMLVCICVNAEKLFPRDGRAGCGNRSQTLGQYFPRP